MIGGNRPEKGPRAWKLISRGRKDRGLPGWICMSKHVYWEKGITQGWRAVSFWMKLSLLGGDWAFFQAMLIFAVGLVFSWNLVPFP